VDQDLHAVQHAGGVLSRDVPGGLAGALFLGRDHRRRDGLQVTDPRHGGGGRRACQGGRLLEDGSPEHGELGAEGGEVLEQALGRGGRGRQRAGGSGRAGPDVDETGPQRGDAPLEVLVRLLHVSSIADAFRTP
jgi:hypothetical protein